MSKNFRFGMPVRPSVIASRWATSSSSRRCCICDDDCFSLSSSTRFCSATVLVSAISDWTSGLQPVQADITAAQGDAGMVQAIAVVAGSLAGLSQHADDRFQLRLDALPDILDRLAPGLGADEFVVQIAANLGFEALAVGDQNVDRLHQRIILAAVILVPEGEILGIGRHAFMRHALHGGSGKLGGLLCRVGIHRGVHSVDRGTMKLPQLSPRLAYNPLIPRYRSPRHCRQYSANSYGGRRGRQRAPRHRSAQSASCIGRTSPRRRCAPRPPISPRTDRHCAGRRRPAARR